MSAHGYALEIFPQRARKFRTSHVRWHVRLVHANDHTLMTSHGYYQRSNAQRAADKWGSELGLSVKDVTK